MPTDYRSGKEAFTYRDPVTGREVLQLTNSHQRSVHGYYDLPPWSRRTGQIAFSSMEPGASEGGIYVMERDGSNITYLAHSRAMSANDGAMAQWSADGRRVYFKDREDSIPLIAWVDVERGEGDAIPGDLRMICPTGNLNVYHTQCATMPDEALLRDRDGQGVFVMDLGTGATRMIVSVEECLAIHPRRDEIRNWHLYIKHTKWSADGERLMFVFTNEIRYAAKFAEEPRVKDIYVVNVDGSGLRNVGEFGHHPLWHPSGQEIWPTAPGRRPGLSLVDRRGYRRATLGHHGHRRVGAPLVLAERQVHRRGPRPARRGVRVAEPRRRGGEHRAARGAAAGARPLARGHAPPPDVVVGLEAGLGGLGRLRRQPAVRHRRGLTRCL